LTGVARRRARLAALLEARRAAAPPFEPTKYCHAKQATLVNGLVMRLARYVCVLAGRQSGKSHGAVLGALTLASRLDDVAIIYVTSTDASVRKMAFEPAKKMNRVHKLGGKARSSSPCTVSFPNGSTVYFIGADSDRTIERLRGTPNLVLCIIDECGIYESEKLSKMIEAVTPGLRPLAGGLVLMGTPSLQGPQGTFYGATVNAKFEQHRFGYLDNDRVPSFADVEKIIDEELEALNYTRDSAYFKREYLCDFVVELSERVYQLAEANFYDADVPGDLTECVVGGDVGVSDCDALLSLRWKKTDPLVWVGDEQEASGQDALEFGVNVRAIYELRHPFKIAVDPGGGGKKTILTVQKLHPGIPIKEADKPSVAIQVRAVNALAQTGRLRVKRGSKLALELARATWKDGLVGGEIDEHGKHSDLVPSLRYACIAATPYLPKKDVTPDAPAVADRKAEWASVVKQAQRLKVKKPLARVVLGRRPAA
jgi:terminase large subunit-like protein